MQRSLKRTLDVTAAIIGLLATGWIILLAMVLARIDTGEPGLFRQVRIGRGGEPFEILKIRTMRGAATTTVTASGDPRITPLGRFFRRYKLDELPQLVNVLKGDMSLVGPRPDVAGFADRLTGEDRIVLMVRPGITGPATLRFRNEEELLADRSDPETYNREVLFPAKVRLNREYVERYSLRSDLRYLWDTVMGRNEGSPHSVNDQHTQE
jgi:lipopolysaccharide/colanic/teichoic acid biosynthesis glycosyltransferase